MTTRIRYKKKNQYLLSDHFLIDRSLVVKAIIDSTTYEYKIVDSNKTVYETGFATSVRSAMRKIRTKFQEIGVRLYDEVKGNRRNK